MRIAILLQITDDDGVAAEPEVVVAFDKPAERPEDLGLSITDGKALLVAVQERMVTTQAAVWSHRHRNCPACGQSRLSKGRCRVVFHTLGVARALRGGGLAVG